MKSSTWLIFVCAGLLGILAASPASAADLKLLAAPNQGDWTAHNFRFHTGEVMPDLLLHYTTIGAPTGEPV